MKTLVTYALAASALLALGNVTANSRDYVNITGDELLQCLPDQSFDEGGACFDAGHVVPDENGQATVTVTDSVTSPTSAFWCQDIDGDGSCDDDTETIFCGQLTFEAGVQWDPGAPLFIFLDGPVFGNIVLSACGTAYSGGHVGSVDHS